ncbi:MAG: hypothetical protein U1F10_10175 [Burkholderiales bacterium]
MNRRHFLAHSLPGLAAASMGVTGCSNDSGTAQPPAPIGSGFPKPVFITSNPGFSDYRPSPDRSGQNILFERTVAPNPRDENTQIFIIRGVGTANPTVAPFLTVPANPPATWPYSQTRPDWSWVTNEVAFSGGPNNQGPNQVHLVAGDGVAPRLVADTNAHIYPIWTSDGKQLVVYDENTNVVQPGPPRIGPPVTRLINPDGTVVQSNMNGLDIAGVQVFGGFAAPKPGNPLQIAFAGQPALPYWGATPPNPLPNPLPLPVYNQDNNYVFVNAYRGGVFTSQPLESAAPVVTYDPAYQGRAPYWSPDGNYVVFESSRMGGYALFLANVAKGTAPVQLTEATYWAQHAKFLPYGTSVVPSGKGIVYTALQTPNATGNGPRGIVVLDIGAFLT